MKTINKISAAALISTALCSATVYADGPAVAVGPRIGTQGFGVEASMPITEGVFGRINANYVQITRSTNGDQVNLKGKLTLLSIPVMVDWHPFEGSGFRLSAGAAYNGNKFEATGSAAQGVTYDGVFYSATEVGSITTEVKLGSTFAGIVSLGYDSSFMDKNPLSFNFEVGVMYAGKPKLSVSSTGIGGAILKEKIRQDAQKSVDKIEKYLKFFPIVAIGFKYSF